MKIFLGVTIVCLCVFISYNLSLKYVERKKFYSSFNSFNKKLLSEVLYTKNTIIEIIKKEKVKDDLFYKLLNSYFLEKKTPELNKKIYNNDEIEFVANYFKQIGSTDNNAQLLYLKSIESDLDCKLKNVTSDEKKYKTLYIKLGFLLGLLLFVIII